MEKIPKVHIEMVTEKTMDCEVQLLSSSALAAEFGRSLYFKENKNEVRTPTREIVTVCCVTAKGKVLCLLRPVTLFPFPTKRLQELSGQVKSMMTIELNLGQMVDDVRLAVNGACPVGFYGRQGGNIFTPDEIVDEFKKFNNLK